MGEPLTPGTTLRVLERLIDKSLVVPEDRGGFVRLTMLEMLREYAHDRVVEAGEYAQLRRRQFDWVLDSVESIDPDHLTSREVAARRLEIDNVRCALGWAIEVADAGLALRLATDAAVIWYYAGNFAEGISWLRRALDLPHADELHLLRGRALKGIGDLSFGLGDMHAARTAILQADELIAGEKDADGPPLCSQILGEIKRASGDLEGALVLFRQALGEYQACGLRFWEELTLFLISSVLFEQGNYAESRAACDRCVALGGEFAWATARARVILAYLANHDGDPVEAERLAEEALTQLRAQAELSGAGIALRALAQFALEQGRVGRAWTCLAEALEIALAQGDRMALARTLETIACVLASHAPAEALRIAGAAATLRTRTGTMPWPLERARLDRWLAVARGQLRGQAYADNWRVGSCMSDAEAASTARRFVAEALAADPDSAPKAVAPHPLTPRQQEVAALVARGLTNVQIGVELVISPATARAHVEHILDRLDLHSRAQLAAWAAAHRLGMIQTERFMVKVKADAP
jgi:non-specific serine/threonine protein kinase